MIYWFTNALHDWLAPLGLYRFFQVFQWPSFRTLCAIVFCFFFVVLMGRRTIRWLIKQKIADNPEFYHADLNRLMERKTTTPTMGGLLVSGAIFIAILLLADLGNFYVQMALICLVWLAVLGGVDDWLKLTSARRTPGTRDGLKMWEKLVFQIAIALLLGLVLYTAAFVAEVTPGLSLPLCSGLN